MLRKILLTLFVFISLAAGVVGYIYLQKVKMPVSPAINAIPLNASIIVQTYDTRIAWEKFRETNILWKDLISIDLFDKTNTKLNWLDSVLINSSSLASIIDKNAVFISSVTTGASSGLLFNIGLTSGIDEKELDELIKEAAPEDAYFSTRIVDGTIVYQVKTKSDSSNFSWCIAKSVFIASFHAELLESSLKQLASGNSFSSMPAFNKVFSTIGNDSKANVFINHSAILPEYSMYLNDSLKEEFNMFKNYAQFSAFDLSTKPNSMSLSGFSFASDSANNYLSIFNDQQPQKIQITSVMPSNTASFQYFGLSNTKAFITKYEKYLEKRGELKERTRILNSFEEKSGVDISDAVLSWLGNEMAAFITEPNTSLNSDNYFVALKAFNTETALKKLEPISELITKDAGKKEPDTKEEEKPKKKKKKSEEDSETVEDADSVTNIEPIIIKYPIYKLKINNVLQPLLGQWFCGVTQNYYTVIGEYILLGNSREALEEAIQFQKANRTIQSSEVYNSFNENISAEATLYLYSGVARSLAMYSSKLSASMSETFNANKELLQKFEALAIQISPRKGLFYNNIYLKHNPVYKKETNSLWEVELEAPVACKPKVVTNHLTNAKEVFVQDELNNIYLINNKGEILWKTKIEGSIRSDVYQIDRYKNNKLQYVFNTQGYLYMLDRNGKNCDGFPIELKHKATNELSVFDYDNTREYRLMLACENNRLYNFTVEGEPVNGWEFTLMKNTIRNKVQHFVIDGKDYIAVIDKEGNVRLVDRKGKEIIAFTQKVPIAVNSDFYIDKNKDFESSSLYSSDSTGRVLKLLFNNTLEILDFGKKSANHYFDYKDLDDDKKREFIFVDQNQFLVYSQDKSLFFTYKFGKPIKHKPMYFLFPNGESKLGVTSSGTGEIFLFNNKGSLESGFPKYGTTPFSIGDINEDNVFNVIVGASDKHIYIYSIK